MPESAPPPAAGARLRCVVRLTPLEQSTQEDLLRGVPPGRPGLPVCSGCSGSIPVGMPFLVGFRVTSAKPELVACGFSCLLGLVRRRRFTLVE